MKIIKFLVLFLNLLAINGDLFSAAAVAVPATKRLQPNLIALLKKLPYSTQRKRDILKKVIVLKQGGATNDEIISFIQAIINSKMSAEITNLYKKVLSKILGYSAATPEEVYNFFEYILKQYKENEFYNYFNVGLWTVIETIFQYIGESGGDFLGLDFFELLQRYPYPNTLAAKFLELQLINEKNTIPINTIVNRLNIPQHFLEDILLKEIEYCDDNFFITVGDSIDKLIKFGVQISDKTMNHIISSDNPVKPILEAERKQFEDFRAKYVASPQYLRDLESAKVTRQIIESDAGAILAKGIPELIVSYTPEEVIWEAYLREMKPERYTVV